MRPNYSYDISLPILSTISSTLDTKPQECQTTGKYVRELPTLRIDC